MSCQSGDGLLELTCLRKAFQRVVTRLLHLGIDVFTEPGHDLEQSSVVVHEAAAELGGVFGNQSQPSCRRGQTLAGMKPSL